MFRVGSHRVFSAFLWGLVGVMCYLVLAKGSLALAGPALAVWQHALVAVAVGVTTASGAYLLEERIAAAAARRRTDG